MSSGVASSLATTIVLAVERGKMSYHDDGERGVGPIVASLSLGSDATMSFRAKLPKQARKVVNQNPELPEASGIAPVKVLAKDGDLDAPSPIGATPVKNKKSKKPVLQVQLRHGDVMIMEVSRSLPSRK